jgi:purine nucleosidase
MIDLIYDCDITMGLPGRDIDDGLALLYLLGCPAIRLLGITSSFGNGSIKEVHACLLSVLEDLGRSDIPAYSGASREGIPPASRGPAPAGGDWRAHSEAARFLADTVRANPAEVSILATGSPTNLLGAYRLHSGFFRDAKHVVLMGGSTEPLVVNGQEMGELNFASDPEAALFTLYAGDPPDTVGAPAVPGRPSPLPAQEADRCPITVISGNLCLQALLAREHFAGFIEEARRKVAKGFIAYLEDKVYPWFSWIERKYGLSGFHAWDATAAAYLTDPQLFDPRRVELRSTLTDLSRGYLRFYELPGIATAGTPAAGMPADTPSQGNNNNAAAGTPEARSPETGDRSPWWINIPSRIRDLPLYWQTLFAGWQSTGTAWPTRQKPK